VPHGYLAIICHTGKAEDLVSLSYMGTVILALKGTTMHSSIYGCGTRPLVPSPRKLAFCNPRLILSDRSRSHYSSTP